LTGNENPGAGLGFSTINLLNLQAMPLKSYPDYELMPRDLSEEEIKDPNTLIARFFDFMHLPQHRETLREIQNTLVTGGFCDLSTQDRADMLLSFDWLQKLIEGVHILYKNARSTN
jgi:hypothetical protein